MNKEKAIETLTRLHNHAVQKGLYADAANVLLVTAAINYLSQLQETKPAKSESQG